MRGRLAERLLRDFDVNHDGKITKGEFNNVIGYRFAEASGHQPVMTEQQFARSHQKYLEAAAAAAFRKLDWNRDGLLSLDEFREGLRARFEKLDKAGTGAIACSGPQRAASAGGKGGRRRAARRSTGSSLAQLCQVADLNHDGKVTRDEYDKAVAARYAAIVKGGKGMSEAQYLADQAVRFDETEARRFKRLDKNGDGKLTLAEFAAPGLKMFDKLDRNHDGVLEHDELARPAHTTRHAPVRGVGGGK